jgi:hypothetical protein
LVDVDLHVHTVTSACGFSSHARILDLARAAGRGVVAVTDHDSAAGAVAVRDLAARSGDDVVVLVGMELTTSDFGHVVVFGRGVEEDWGWRKHSPFPRDLPEHWVAIQAHPFRDLVKGRLEIGEVPELPALPELGAPGVPPPGGVEAAAASRSPALTLAKWMPVPRAALSSCTRRLGMSRLVGTDLPR